MANSKYKKRPWMGAFLAALREGQTVTQASRNAGITNTTPYAHRRNNAGFAQDWEDALTHQEKAAKQPHRNGAWQRNFLEALAETSNITAAAKKAGIALHMAYAKRKSDPKFAAQWDEALLEGYKLLEMELLCYLRDPKPKRKMDVGATLRALAAHRETTAKVRAFKEDEDEQEVLESIDNFLKDMRQKRRANADILQMGKAKDAADRTS